jgi:MFS family permease
MILCANTLSGSFGGILAFGISRMNGLGGQEGWRWIFYIEGIATVIIGAVALFLINDFPSDRPKFLTEEECDRTISRLQNDAGPGTGENFSWKQVRAAFLEWKIYIFCLCYIGIVEPSYSLAYFSPTIIQSLGFQSYHAQLMTAPPYAFSFITTMTTAYFSDRYARRAVFILFWLPISIIGFIILIVVENSNVKYFAIFLTVGGLSPCAATCVTFLSCNIGPNIKRATAVAFMISFGNIGGAISGQIYRSEDAPRFILGHAINLGFCVMAFIANITLFISLRLENRRRDHLYGPIVTNNSQTNLISIAINREIVNGFGLDTEQNRRKWGYENMSDEEIRELGDRHATWRYII